VDNRAPFGGYLCPSCRLSAETLDKARAELEQTRRRVEQQLSTVNYELSSTKEKLAAAEKELGTLRPEATELRGRVWENNAARALLETQPLLRLAIRVVHRARSLGDARDDAGHPIDVDGAADLRAAVEAFEAAAPEDLLTHLEDVWA
jgi:chromosome segregation ATPase